MSFFDLLEIEYSMKKYSPNCVYNDDEDKVSEEGDLVLVGLQIEEAGVWELRLSTLVNY